MKQAKEQALLEMHKASELAAVVIDKAAVRAAEVLAAANSSYGTAIAVMGNDIKNIEKAIARVEENMKQTVPMTDFNEHLKADADHELRIRILERAMWKYIGIAASISAFVAFFGNYLLNKIH